VEAAKHVHGLALNQVEERVRKSTEQNTAGVPMDRRVELGLALDRGQSGFNCQKEF
jgi:hypothetical protein